MKSLLAFVTGLAFAAASPAFARGDAEKKGETGGLAPAVAGGGRPEFSWDTVPLYIHVGKNGGFTDEEIEFVAARSNFVCLEKGHGASLHGGTEKGIEHDAARLKAANSKMKVIYYWNTFLDYPMYEAHRVYERHPEWWLRTLDGSLDKKRGTLKRYDLSNAEIRQWWAEEVRKAVVDGSCDGVFMDAFPQIAAAANIKLWGKEKYDAILDGLVATVALTRKKVGADGILVFNGIRNTNSLHFGMQYLDVADGAIIEHFDQFQSRDKENVAGDIEDMIAAGKRGKIVIMKGWPGFTWLDEEIRGARYDELLARARESITFPLACFLVAARPHSYFCYSWGYREQHGSLSDYRELSRPLGEPAGDATRNGWIYTRSFEHVDVWLDVSEKTAKLNWK